MILSRKVEKIIKNKNNYKNVYVCYENCKNIVIRSGGNIEIVMKKIAERLGI